MTKRLLLQSISLWLLVYSFVAAAAADLLQHSEVRMKNIRHRRRNIREKEPQDEQQQQQQRWQPPLLSQTDQLSRESTAAAAAAASASVTTTITTTSSSSTASLPPPLLTPRDQQILMHRILGSDPSSPSSSSSPRNLKKKKNKQSSTSSSTPPKCTTIQAQFTYSQIINSLNATRYGTLQTSLPFLNLETNKMGSMTVTGLLVGPNLTNPVDDCTLTRVYNFDTNEAAGIHNQIMQVSTCYGLAGAITGGTGKYGCAAGWDHVSYQDSANLIRELNVCGALCPFKFK